jgi:hypothetical protein
MNPSTIISQPRDLVTLLGGYRAVGPARIIGMGIEWAFAIAGWSIESWFISVDRAGHFLYRVASVAPGKSEFQCRDDRRLEK